MVVAYADHKVRRSEKQILLGGQSTAIRLDPSCFRNPIIFVDVGVPKILYGTLKSMSEKISSRDTLAMVTISPDLWECVVHQFCLGWRPVGRLLSTFC